MPLFSNAHARCNEIKYRYIASPYNFFGSLIELICSYLHKKTFLRHLKRSISFFTVIFLVSLSNTVPSLDYLPKFSKARVSPHDDLDVLCLTSSLRRQLVTKFIMTFPSSVVLFSDTMCFPTTRKKLSRLTPFHQW